MMTDENIGCISINIYYAVSMSSVYHIIFIEMILLF